MRIIHESKQKHLYFSVAFALSIALAPTSAYAVGNRLSRKFPHLFSTEPKYLLLPPLCFTCIVEKKRGTAIGSPSLVLFIVQYESRN